MPGRITGGRLQGSPCITAYFENAMLSGEATEDKTPAAMLRTGVLKGIAHTI